MLTIGGSIFCLTYALVEANSRGWGSTLIVSLFAASALLAAAFAITQRFGRFPMLTAALVRNRQFVGANLAFLLFAIGMLGTLFMTVLFFVNLWGYSELEAALAITPVPAMALVVAPIVGRISNQVSPRLLGIPALTAAAGAMFWLSALPAEPSFWSAIGPLALLGAGIGATFPAISIGSMGSIQGQELGLGSGIVNMSRQVGFAIGVALLVAVFTGSIDNQLRDARHEVAAVVRSDGGSPAQYRSFFEFDPAQPGRRPESKTPTEHEVQSIVAEHVRDSYGSAFRVASLSVLLAIPFALTMRRRPMDTQREADQVAVAAGG
jgi:Na+/melibiose symporter-like transporter